jgi:hypothetical protein
VPLQTVNDVLKIALCSLSTAGLDLLRAHCTRISVKMQGIPSIISLLKDVFESYLFVIFADQTSIHLLLCSALTCMVESHNFMDVPPFIESQSDFIT